MSVVMNAVFVLCMLSVLSFENACDAAAIGIKENSKEINEYDSANTQVPPIVR